MPRLSLQVWLLAVKMVSSIQLPNVVLLAIAPTMVDGGKEAAQLQRARGTGFMKGRRPEFAAEYSA